MCNPIKKIKKALTGNWDEESKYLIITAKKYTQYNSFGMREMSGVSKVWSFETKKEAKKWLVENVLLKNRDCYFLYKAEEKFGK